MYKMDIGTASHRIRAHQCERCIDSLVQKKQQDPNSKVLAVSQVVAESFFKFFDDVLHSIYHLWRFLTGFRA